MSRKTVERLGTTLSSDGVVFGVWAPFAKSVAVSGTFNDWDETPMERKEDSWTVTIKEAAAGHEYKYRIDTGTDILLRNDPRSRQVTDSDNGTSVIVDESFDWEDTMFTPPPKNQQIIYEMHIGTFNRPDAGTSGTFYTAIEKLDYLTELGINMIELMPVASMAFSSGWGYAPSYIFSVENTYGGRHGLLEFVKACHERGIGVILDVVYNHFYAKTDLWNFDGWDGGGGGIYFYNDERGDTPWDGRRPDYGRPEVRQYILDNVAMWLTEFRIDGLRLDSTIYMRNTVGWNDDSVHDLGEAWSLLGDISRLAHKINPSTIVIAEDNASNAYITKSTSDNGIGFDAQWELGFPHALREAIGVVGDSGNISQQLTTSGNDDLFRRIVFSDSHDTAANGSARLNQNITPDNPASVFAREEILLANAITLTTPGVPMLLQGAEFLQEGSFNDWQMLDWKKADKFSGIVLAHKHLNDLRLNVHGNTAGLLGEFIAIFHHDVENRVLGYHRWDKGGPCDDVIVVANFSDKALSQDYTMTLPLKGSWRIRFTNNWKGYSSEFPETHNPSEISTDENGNASIQLAAYSVIILSQDK